MLKSSLCLAVAAVLVSVCGCTCPCKGTSKSAPRSASDPEWELIGSHSDRQQPVEGALFLMPLPVERGDRKGSHSRHRDEPTVTLTLGGKPVPVTLAEEVWKIGNGYGLQFAFPEGATRLPFRMVVSDAIATTTFEGYLAYAQRGGDGQIVTGGEWDMVAQSRNEGK